MLNEQVLELSQKLQKEEDRHLCKVLMSLFAKILILWLDLFYKRDRCFDFRMLSFCVLLLLCQLSTTKKCKTKFPFVLY